MNGTEIAEIIVGDWYSIDLLNPKVTNEYTYTEDGRVLYTNTGGEAAEYPYEIINNYVKRFWGITIKKLCSCYSFYINYITYN